MGRKKLTSFVKYGSGLLLLALFIYFLIQSIVTFATLDTTNTYVNTSVTPDKWSKNNTQEVFNFTITVSNGNVTLVNITVPGIGSNANFTVPTDITPSTISGWSFVDFPENYTNPNTPKVIRFNASDWATNAITSGQSIWFAFNATPIIAEAIDNSTQAWNIFALHNDSMTNDTTTLYTFVDNKPPTLSTPIPWNTSWINGNASQIFSIVGSDSGSLIKNGTLYYKKAGEIGNYYTQSLSFCSGSNTICNTTLDLSSSSTYPHGTEIRYYFQLCDNVENCNFYGQPDVYLWTKIDRNAPEYSNNQTSPSSGTIYSPTQIYYFNLSVIDPDSGVSEVIFEFNNINYTYSSGSVKKSGNVFYNTSVGLDANPSGYQFKWYMKDSVGNWNVTETWYYVINKAPNIVNLNFTNSTGNFFNQNIIITYTEQTTATATSSVGTVYLYRNDTLITSGASPQQETTILGAGVHMYHVNTTGNNNYLDNSTGQTFSITVNKAIPTVNIITNMTSGVYPNFTNVTGWENNFGDSDMNYILYRNDTQVTSGSAATDITLLGVGHHIYIYNTTGGANYTSASTSTTIDITKGIPPIYLTLNGTQENRSYTYPESMNATGWLNTVNLEGIVELFRNNGTFTTLIGSDDAVSDVIRLGTGTYNYSLRFNATENYTSAYINTNRFATVNKGSTSISLFINDTEENKTYNLTQVANFTAVLNFNPDGTNKQVCLISNMSGWGTPQCNQSTSPFLINYTTLNTVGKFNMTAYFLGDSNYTASSKTLYLTVRDVVNPTVNIILPQEGQYVRGTITINASVQDDYYTSKSEFRIWNITGGFWVDPAWILMTGYGLDGKNNGYYTGTYLTTQLSNGNYAIYVKATDSSNNENQKSVQIIVDNTPPTILTTYPSEGQYVKAINGNMWINGTVFDNLAMGAGNVTINDTRFEVYSFNGTNNTQFAFVNNTTVADDSVSLRISYSDNATNTGIKDLKFYVDNTPPDFVFGNTTGFYQSNTTQEVIVTVKDNLQTNASITLHYGYFNATQGITQWNSTIMTGNIGKVTTYKTTISTWALPNGTVVGYYVTGTDNATNLIPSNIGGTDSIPLANFTIDRCAIYGNKAWICVLDTADEGVWANFKLPRSILETASSLQGNYSVANVLNSIEGKYTIIYYHNSTQWVSYVPGRPVNDFIEFIDDTNNEVYWINMTQFVPIRIP